MAYQEYYCVYGEDVVTALRFLFNAMTAKVSLDFPMQGIPLMIYSDNGLVARSQVFQRVMRYLGVDARTHMPAGSDGRRTTGGATGKVERPFRTVKEVHETLFHFQKPRDEAEANAWLQNFLIRYNAMIGGGSTRSDQRACSVHAKQTGNSGASPRLCRNCPTVIGEGTPC